MKELLVVLERVATTNELMVYALLCLGMLTFLGLVVSVVGIYRASAQHRETLETMNRMSYYLFKKLGPVELP